MLVSGVITWELRAFRKTIYRIVLFFYLPPLSTETGGTPGLV